MARSTVYLIIPLYGVVSHAITYLTILEKFKNKFRNSWSLVIKLYKSMTGTSKVVLKKIKFSNNLLKLLKLIKQWNMNTRKN